MLATLLDDGFSTKIAFSTSTFTLFEETSVTIPSFSGGGDKNATSMRNTRVRTKIAKKLYEVGNLELTVRYDAAIINQVKASLQVNQLINITLSNGGTFAVWGWLEEFTPNENTEGDIPLADIVIVVSNLNASFAETAPVYTAPV